MSKATNKTASHTETAKPAKSAARITPLKKLTVKAICGGVKLVDIPADGELMLCRMAGVAHATQSGESTYGVWEALVGEFAATSYITGEIFVGKHAFIPGAMGDALIGALNNAQLEDASASMKFSVDVSVVVSPRDPNKYEYMVRPVIESDVTNQAVALLGLDA